MSLSFSTSFLLNIYLHFALKVIMIPEQVILEHVQKSSAFGGNDQHEYSVWHSSHLLG